MVTVMVLAADVARKLRRLKLPLDEDDDMDRFFRLAGVRSGATSRPTRGRAGSFLVRGAVIGGREWNRLRVGFVFIGA
jgi:hypothetical protein